MERPEFGTGRLVAVPVDGQGRMRADRLPALDGAAIVCTQAGNVNTGSFDPVGEIRARARGAWVHVDGAFGLWAAAAPARAHLATGVYVVRLETGSGTRVRKLVVVR